MKAETYSLAVEARLILSGRELEVLNHICSYDASKYFESIVSSHYNHGVQKEEMVNLFQDLRSTTGNLMQIITAANKEAFDPFRILRIK